MAEGNTDKRDSSVTVKVLDKGMRASIQIVSASDGGTEPTAEMVFQALKKEKIIYGIDTDLIHNIIKNEQFDESIDVAFGTPSEDGVDGYVKFLFLTKRNVAPKEDEKGNVDFKEIQLIQNVKKEDRLAETISPVPGKDGKTVLNETILPVVGGVAKLPVGPNTNASPDNPNILVSSIDGNVILKGGSVSVESVYIVPTSVDFQTGNIDYVGSLLIKGDVKSGFEVRSENDVQIEGLVEDAKVISGGSVVIKKGIVGKGKGIIEAKGDVILKFCENQTIKAKGNIIVGEAVLHSTLICESTIEVQGSKGTIVGGLTRATKGLVVKELGSYQETKTEIIAGVDDELTKKLEDLKEQHVKSDQNMDEIKKAIYVLFKNKMKVGKLPPEQEQLLNKLQVLQGQIPNHKKELEEKKNQIEEEMKKYNDVTIDVLSKVYRGVSITLLNLKKTIKDETTKVRYRVENNEIIEVTL